MLLCIETNLLVDVSVNKVPFYLFIFFCTCIYYTRIYVRSVGAKNYNERTLWYRSNLLQIKRTLYFFKISAVLLAVFLIATNFHFLILLSPLQLAFIFLFPLIAAWYTFSSPFLGLKKIRQTGWIKPFIVGFTWAGWVTVYPLLLFQLQNENRDNIPILPSLLLFVLNFLLFSTNAVIFDIKDYRNDFLHRLKTLPVIFGIRNTFRFVLVPLIILNLTVFFIFRWQQHFSVCQTLILLIPYLFLVIITMQYRKQRSVLYYLVVVDGLVFVKALCGITSILLLKK